LDKKYFYEFFESKKITQDEVIGLFSIDYYLSTI